MNSKRIDAAHPRSRGENLWAAPTRPPSEGSSPLTRGKLDASACTSMVERLIPAHAGKTGAWVGWHRTIWAHPRSRGENLTPAGVLVIEGGSSPLTRGKRGLLCRYAHERGLIPAHAGKTGSIVNLHDLCPAHPRSRGENDVVILQARHVDGSSPLTRGKRLEGCGC